MADARTKALQLKGWARFSVKLLANGELMIKVRVSREDAGAAAEAFRMLQVDLASAGPADAQMMARRMK